MNPIHKIINKSLGAIESDQLDQTMEVLGVDSIDLVDLRVNLDQAMGFEIGDSDWLSLESPQDIIDYYQTKNQQGNGGRLMQQEEQVNFRHFKINMPQMALTGLSESWLLKEMGDFHWNVLCHGLSVDSSNIQDELGNRLYATFVRIRLTGNANLRDFKENESLYMNTQMSRYGNGMYFSDLRIKGDEGKELKAELMTTFSFRNKDDNKSLKKGQPFGVNNTIEALSEMAPFGQDYRLLRKQERSEVNLLDQTFQLTDAVLYEAPYQINPYHDLNGVGLLYFAAYPIINDVCEDRYFNAHQTDHFSGRWAKTAYTLARDIYYLNNCDLSDTIRYRVHEATFLPNNRVRLHSTLQRQSDGELLARIFTVKELV